MRMETSSAIQPTDETVSRQPTGSRIKRQTAVEEEPVSTGSMFRNKCISLLALLAGLAALSCAAASMAGTTSWVDCWEPIDLPPSSEWSALFGTGYGSLMPAKPGGRTKGGSKAASGVIWVSFLKTFISSLSTGFFKLSQ